MATATMTRPAALVPRTSRDATPAEIIAAARTAPASRLASLTASCLSAVLMWGAFTPLDWGPLGWICLVPLLALIRIERPTARMYRSAYVGGLVFWLASLQWMRLGDPTMYIAWVALSAYLAAYFPIFIGISRAAVHQYRVPLMVAAPVAWTGLELLRAHLMTGFPWYDLGHSQYRWVELIQISDITGAYGVSFLLVLTSATLVAVLPPGWFRFCQLLPAVSAGNDPAIVSPRRPLVQILACLGIFGIVLCYGFWQRSHAAFAPGPRVALIQGNFPASLKHDPVMLQKQYLAYDYLTSLAVQQQPDLIVWPEGMFPAPLLSTPGHDRIAALDAKYDGFGIRQLHQQNSEKILRDMSQKAGAATLIGLTTVEADMKQMSVYNSAAFFRPDGVAGRYDKIHRVVFGEYIPWINDLPFMEGMTTYRGDFGINKGKASAAFAFRKFRCAPVICFEDTVPHFVRGIVAATRQKNAAGKLQKVDLLVNLSNDGWFHGSSEHDQHLITAAFRSVELRTPLVRAANTGISAIIDGDGVVRSVAQDLKGTGASKQVDAVLVDTVPLDSRGSLYLVAGDWFSGLCLACCFGITIAPVARRAAQRKPQKVAALGT